MTVRFFCDGCGDEINHGNEVRVDVSDKTTSLLNFGGHLCESCRRHLVMQADPKKWPRAAKAAE